MTGDWEYAATLDLIYGYGVDVARLTSRERAEALAWWEWRQQQGRHDG